jgi:nicotinate-nucleotide adenylyltransferase
MTRIAFFGGTFDPPHRGHTEAASWVARSGEVDEVLVVPVYGHAFDKKPWLDFEVRCELCRLAFGGRDHVSVSDIEATLPRPSYTIETIRALKRKYPDASFRLVVGTDIVSDLPRWREAEELLRIAPPLVLARKGYDGPGIAADLPEISSSELRAMLVERRASPSPELEARLLRFLEPQVLARIWERGYDRNLPRSSARGTPST